MKKKGSSKAVSDLAARIASVRKSMGLNQREFADKLRVSPALISQWENDLDAPSIEKRIALVNLAPVPADKIFFLTKAGTTEQVVREAFVEDAAGRIGAAKSGIFVKVPLYDNLLAGADGKPQSDSETSLLLPLKQFGAASSVAAFKVSEPLAQIFASGDIAIVDRSPVDPDKLIDSMVAVFFEKRPEFIDANWSRAETARYFAGARHVTQEEIARERQAFRAFAPKAFAAQEAENESASERAWKKTQDFMSQPLLKFGWLRLQPAGDQWEPRPMAEQLFRVALEIEPSPSGYTGLSIPLTPWIKEIMPLEPKIAEHVTRPNHILGRVVGWIGQGGLTVRPRSRF